MTIVNIFLHDVALNWERGDSVIFSAPVFREGTGGSIVSTAPVRVPLEPDGTATVDLEPGPVDVQFKCRSYKDDRPKRGVVPDEGPVGLEEVIGGGFEYAPPVINRGLDQIEDARDEAVAAIDDTVARWFPVETAREGMGLLWNGDGFRWSWLDQFKDTFVDDH